MTTDFSDIVADWPEQVDGQFFWLDYHIGSEFYGETAAHFEADGKYELWSTATPGRERRQFSGRCDPKEVRDIVALIKREQLWTVQHVQPNQADDDSLAILQVGDATRHARIELWVSEIESVPSFGRVQTAVLDVIRRLSGGEILEAGR
jgi:hypothetical protein